MKKPGRPPGSPGSHLSDEDRAIWRGTADTLKPLKAAKARVHQAKSPLGPSRVTPGEGVEDRTAQGKGSVRPHEPVPVPLTPTKPAPPLADYDRKAERRLGRGQAEVQARIDLHGLRQNEAHAALRRFLFDCASRGLRHVLVITGKGAPARPRWEVSRELDTPQPGVLRRNVPLWLAEPDLRPIVISFTPAALRHGGEGALYVHLRNRERAR